MDTIFALASAAGKAGVAVIRVSGPEARVGAEALTGADIPSRGMVLRCLQDAQGLVLDDALVLSFTAPASFSGEDVIEYHTHGSVAVVRAVLERLSELPGHRIAEPGEFTRRALENGKLDLSQVEGLADLIDAETEAQRSQAQRLLAGDLGAVAGGWRRKLVRAASLIEATIDFADEDVPVDVTPEVMSLLQGVQSDLDAELSGSRMAERIREGFEVAIVGPPNAGKSTLLNRLAGRKAALTSEVAGTTRDVIEVRMDLDGLPVTILDTAGLRKTDDHVENLGISLAKDRAEAADIRIFLTDGAEIDGVAWREGDICVRGKADLLPDRSSVEAVSGLTGKGLDRLTQRMSETLAERSSSAGLATRERHRVAMAQAMDGLASAIRILSEGPDSYDLAAEDIRRSIRALEFLVGHVDVENLLDEIFASFCLGK